MADLEGLPKGEFIAADLSDVRSEARQLARDLAVAANLGTYSAFMKEADDSGGVHGSSYRLMMNAETGEVSVKSRWFGAYDSEISAEFDTQQQQSVEVSVDNMEALRMAYPNYFLDVTKFLAVLEDLQGGSAARPTQNSIESYDLSFLKTWKKGR